MLGRGGVGAAGALEVAMLAVLVEVEVGIKGIMVQPCR